MNKNDFLGITFQVQGDGTLKASLQGVSKETLGVAAAAEKMNRELAEVRDRADPAGAALRRLARDKETLNLAVQKGLITQAQANDSLSRLDRQARATSGGLSTLRQAIGAIGLSAIVTQTVGTIAEFERLGAVLRTLEGSQEGANRKLRELQEIASKTPSQLQEIVQAYSTLKARGLDPGREALLAYSNVAAATGKNLQQVVEAVGDAATGEFERIKDFGIIARQQGDKVALTFQGVTTVIQKEAGAIEDYLQRIGRVNFAGANEQQMKTLVGAAANLGDELSKLAVTIGEGGLTGELKELAQELTRSTKELNAFLRAANNREGLEGFLATWKGAAEAMTLPGLISGDIFDFLPDEAKIRQTTAAANEQKGAIDLLADAYKSASAFVREGFAEALGKTNEATTKAKEESTKLLVKLREQAATYGLTRSQLLEYEKAQALATATSAEQRTEIAALYDVLIRKASAEEHAAKATKVGAEADRDAKKASEERRREVEKMTAAAERAGQGLTQMLSQQADLLAGPVDRAYRDYLSVLEEIEAQEIALLNLGPLSADNAERLALARSNAAQVYAVDLADAEAAGRDAALAQLDGYEQTFMRGLEDLKPAIRDGLSTGDWGDVGKRLAESIVGGMLDTFLDENIIKPLQDALLSGLQGNGSASSSGGGWLQSLLGLFGRSGGAATATNSVGPLASGYAYPAAGGVTGAAGGAAGGAGGLASAVPVIGWIYAGMQLNRSLAQQGWTPGGQTSEVNRGALMTGSLGTAITTIISTHADRMFRSLGLSNSTAAMLSGSAVMTRLFGHRAPRIEEQGIQGTYGFGGFEGERYANIEQRGGLFRSDRNWTETDDLEPEIDRMFDRAIANIRRGAERIGAQLGISLDEALDALSFDAELVLSDDPEEARRQMEDYVARMQDALAQGALDALNAGALPALSGLTAAEALGGLGQLTTYLEHLERSLDQLDPDPVVQMRNAIEAMAQTQADAFRDLDEALENFDPGEIAQAAAQAEAAVVARYQAEIDLARTLEAALLQAQAAGRATDLQLAQRIQAAGGPVGLVAGVARGNFETTRGLVGNTANPERALAFLSEFVSGVDAWLSASIADVQQLAAAEQTRIATALAGIASQREAINAMLASLVAERDAIMGAATERARTEQAAQQAAFEAERQAMEQLRQEQIAGLQEQLSIAQRFADVLRQADDFLRELTFSSSNPLGGFGRLSLLGNAISGAETRLAGSTGVGRADAAEELLELLQQRIGLVQQEGLFQRPSDDYLALYNDTLRRINDVRGIAQPEADLALELQEQLNRLQEETTQAVRDLGDLNIRLTDAEQARLDEIAAEEALLQLELRVLARSEVALQELLLQVQQDAEAEIAALNATAREQYEWARGEATRLEDERQAAILAQLNELTGGRPVDEFIAERTAEAASLLTDIRDDLRAFLAAISSGATIDGAVPGIGTPLPGGDRPDPNDDSNPIGKFGDTRKPYVFAPVININGASGDPQHLARVMRDTITRELPQFATQLKRELGTA